jgi:hypothetical protein
MTWKNFIKPVAIASRRRVIASALVYGLSLSVRFTSATGEEVQIPPAAAREINPAPFMANDGARASYSHWSLKSIQPIAFQPGWPIAVTSMPGCTADP